MKIFSDTLRSPNGKWSRKSLQAFSAFLISIFYGVCLPFIWKLTFKENFDLNETVFVGFLGMSGGALALSVYEKVKNKQIDADCAPTTDPVV